MTGDREAYYQLRIAGLTPFQKLMLDLDSFVTGVPPERAVSQYHHMPDSVEKWLQQEGGGCPLRYLSDGGYSRLVWNEQTNEIWLTSNSTSKAKTNWEAAGPQRKALQDYLASEINKMRSQMGESAGQIVNKLLDEEPDK